MTRRDTVLKIIRAEPGLTRDEIRQRMPTDDGSMSPYRPDELCNELLARGMIKQDTGPDGTWNHFPVAYVTVKGSRRRVTVTGCPSLVE